MRITHILGAAAIALSTAAIAQVTTNDPQMANNSMASNDMMANDGMPANGMMANDSSQPTATPTPTPKPKSKPR